MIHVVKASAGSGKTYTLAHSYLNLLTERFAYRHILAVTFTNKATAEMKGRILKFLSEDGSDDKRRMLSDILHDYSAFSVSTIDKFFQQALKAFAREIGQMADYRIDLDRDSLIDEAMDRILDSLTEDSTDVLDWLREQVAARLAEGKKPRLEDSLYRAGKMLMAEEQRELAERYGIDVREAFGKERLAAVRSCCNRIIEDFTGKLNSAAKKVSVKDGRALRSLQKYLAGFRPGSKIEYPAATLAREAAGTTFMELFDGPEYIWFNTALELRKNLLDLGLAREFYASFDSLLKEKNLLCLDESNTILKDIIAGSDAPFVYEKLGVRYEHFLLDEFQDTSNIQWENFRPLLRESEASRHDNLIVGDVKQSIYRWRRSDWRLLAERVAEEFPSSEKTVLDDNWRSLPEIVEFNNGFFKYAAAAINRAELYADVRQVPRTPDTQEGYVRASFCDKDDVIPRILESIGDARKAGARYGDIAILVRRNFSGSVIAESLVREGIPVISDDSLGIDSSLTVRRLVGLLANHENPDDNINAYIARTRNVEFPSEYHSLVDLCENLLRQLRDDNPEAFEGDSPFIQAFMDNLREWVDANGNELRYFLQYWKEKPGTINSPENSDAVRIITVHKAKGLEFPYLIFPYAETVERFHDNDMHWCHLHTEGTPFCPEAEGIYPLAFNGNLEKTLFAEDLHHEMDMQDVDNLNIFYVAMTRAEKCLHVIASNYAGSNGTPKGPDNFKNFAQLLYTYCGGAEEFTRGSMYDFSLMERPRTDRTIPLTCPYVSTALGDRLKVSADASDFFGEDGGTGAAASPRRNGIVLHGILSQVQQAADLRRAVDSSVLDGQLSAGEGEDAFRLLSARIASHPGWFCERGLNEVSLFDANGAEKRPDRVVIHDGKVLVIDYKFGVRTPEADSKYRAQVSSYMRIFRGLG